MEERLKAKKILDELLNFFIVRNASDIQCEIKYVENGSFMKVKGPLEVTEAEVALFSATLEEERNPSLEDYYEELLGTSHHEISDYHLIGLMVDQVDIIFQDNILDITCFRKNLT